MTVRLSGIDAVLTDIEGTTSAISFVHDVLFPFARRALGPFTVRRREDPRIGRILDAAKREAGDPGMEDAAVIATLERWIDEDSKITSLKDLQGLIWEEGYRSGELTGHVYDDAASALKRWHKDGIRLYVYSSGSIEAQKLVFGYSSFGDLTPLFSGFFDTTTGSKKDSRSYRRIATVVGLEARKILFLSDSPEEVVAAATAGLATIQFVREGEEQPAAPGQPVARTFTEIEIEHGAASQRSP